MGWIDLKVLIICPVYFPAWEYGGIVPSMHGIVQEIARAGNRVTVYTTDAQGMNERNKNTSELYGTVEVVRFRNLSNYLAWNRIFIPTQMAKAVRKTIGGFDIVHLIDVRFSPNVAANRTASRSKVPYVVTPLDPFKPYLRKALLKRVFDIAAGKKILTEADFVIAQNLKEAESYITLGIPHDRIQMIPNGLDTAALLEMPVKGACRDRLGIPADKKMILYLGRIDHVKGVDLLITAFYRAVRAKELRDSILLVAGPDAGYLKTAYDLVKRLDLASKVVFPGPLTGKDKLAAMQDADLFVLPSRYEEFGIAPLEAYGCGTRVITTTNCGVNHWMKGYFDKIVSPEVDALEEGMTNVLLNSPKQPFDRGANLDNLTRLFSYDNVAKETLNLYRSALSR